MPSPRQDLPGGHEVAPETRPVARADAPDRVEWVWVCTGCGESHRETDAFSEQCDS